MFAILFAIITSLVYPQEKVHVITDREFYMSGDTVWMHSVLVDDIDTTEVKGRSRYLYVELRDIRDSLLNRVKLRATMTSVPPRHPGEVTAQRNITLFSGYMPLPQTIESGEYTLAAYTSYMSGVTELTWFKKRVYVLTPHDVAYGFVPRVVMEPDFIPVRRDSVLSLPEAGGRVPSLYSLAGLKETPQLLVASLNDDKLVPPACTEPYIDEALADIPDIYSPEFIEAVGGVIVPRHPMEVGQVVSGTVYGNFRTRTPQAGTKVDIFSPAETGYFDTQVTDSLGRFEFKGFELADGAVMTIMARKGRGKRVMDNIRIDAPQLPERVRHKPSYKRYFVNRKKYENGSTVSDDAILNADALMKMAQTSDVFHSYLLGEINVSGERKIKVKGAYSSLANRSLDGEQLEEKGVRNLADAIQQMPGFIITNGSIIWRHMYVALFIDMMPECGVPAFDGDDYGFAYTASLGMPISQIARIDFLNETNAAMMGGTPFRGQPAISVTLRVGASLSDSNDARFTLHHPLGYQPLSRFEPNASTRMFVAELGMFLDAAETKWQQVCRSLSTGSAHTLTIQGLTSDGEPFSRVIQFR